MKTVQRKLPFDIDLAIKRREKETGKSYNSIVNDILRKELGLKKPRSPTDTAVLAQACLDYGNGVPLVQIAGRYEFCGITALSKALHAFILNQLPDAPRLGHEDGTRYSIMLGSRSVEPLPYGDERRLLARQAAFKFFKETK